MATSWRRFRRATARRPDGSTWTLEFRHKAGWDQAIPEDAVILHEVRTNSLSYLQPGMWQRFTAGQSGTIPAPKVRLQRSRSMTSAPPTATVRIWDLPNGCLRKEDSKPKVYLIENGTKRWVTSPAVLAWLGQSWADVRLVPDGALRSLPDGPDVVIPPALEVSVSPIPYRRTARPGTVTATDSAPVRQCRVGSWSTERMWARRTPVHLHLPARRIGRPPDVEIIFPTVTVRAAGYPDATVDIGQ